MEYPRGYRSDEDWDREFATRFLAAYTSQQEPVAWGVSISGELTDAYLHKQSAELECARRDAKYPDPTRRFVPLYAVFVVPDGEVVVTTDEEGRCVTVTRQDEEGRILSVIWEAEQVPADMVLVPREPTTEELTAGVAESHRIGTPIDSLSLKYIRKAMIAAWEKKS